MLKKISKIPQFRNKFIERLSFKGFKILLDILPGIAKSLAMCFCGRAHIAGSEIEEVRQEFVRVLSGDAVPTNNVFWKILEIVRDDDICSAAYRGSENMIVLGVGKLERRYKVFKVFNETITDIGIHEVASAFQFVGGKIGTVFENGTDPLIVNHV